MNRHRMHPTRGRQRLAGTPDAHVWVDDPGPVGAPCRHLGAPTGQTVECGSCPSGKTRLKLHACAIHESCALGPQRTPGVTCCVGCPDYAPTPLATLPQPCPRHLLYHVYPARSGGGTWRWNLTMLRTRLGLFTGRKVVAIAHDPETEPPAAVRHELGDDVEYVEVRNVPERREVATHAALWERVEGLPGVTLYAHAKGVTRPPGSTAADWTAVLCGACMDYWPAVERLLDGHACAGPFLRHNVGWPGQSVSTWHYSGSWYWVRNDRLPKDWRRIDPFWSGIEPWPSLHFGAHEAATIFGTIHGDGPGLYDRATMDRHLADWARWQAEHAHERTTP